PGAGQEGAMFAHTQSYEDLTSPEDGEVASRSPEEGPGDRADQTSMEQISKDFSELSTQLTGVALDLEEEMRLSREDKEAVSPQAARRGPGRAETDVCVVRGAGKPVYSRYGSEEALSSTTGVMMALVSFLEAEKNAIRSIHAAGAGQAWARLSCSWPRTGARSCSWPCTGAHHCLTCTRGCSWPRTGAHHCLTCTRGCSWPRTGAHHCLTCTRGCSWPRTGAHHCLTCTRGCSWPRTGAHHCLTCTRGCSWPRTGAHHCLTCTRGCSWPRTGAHHCLTCTRGCSWPRTGAHHCLTCTRGCSWPRTGAHHCLTCTRGCSWPRTGAHHCLTCTRGCSWPRTGAHHCLTCTRGCSWPRTGAHHCLTKGKDLCCYSSPEVEAPYVSEEEKQRLLELYRYLHSRAHNSSRPLKNIYLPGPRENLLAWVSGAFELYVCYSPLGTKAAVLSAVSKLMKWIRREEERLFILTPQTY
uniref:Vacuolar fusion protein MON1 homolog n=1 Tax=Pelodiscus sinensis TaxID=13735 RepID=K7G3G9_PELSI